MGATGAENEERVARAGAARGDRGQPPAAAGLWQRNTQV